MVVPVEPNASRSFRTRLISGGFWAVAGKSLSACGSFVAFVIVANSISSDDTSTFVYCESAAIVGALLATGGLHSVIVRVLRNWRHGFQKQLILSFGRRITAIYLGLFTVVACSAFAFCSWQNSATPHELSYYLTVVILWTLLLGANQIVSEFLRGFENFRDAATMGGQNSGILTLGILLPILLMCRVTGMISIGVVFGSQIFAMAVTLVFGLLRLWQTYKAHCKSDLQVSISPDNDLRVAAIFYEGIPNLFTQITTLGVTQGEILILGQVSTGPEIAAYAGIKRLVQLTGAPLLMINSALPTFIVDLISQKNLSRLEAILRGSATICFLPLMILSVAFIAFPDATIGLFFRADYSVGARCLQLLSVGNIAAVGSGSCGLLLIMSGNQRYAMLSGTIGAIVFVVLAPGLTAAFGITGMALGVTVSIIVRNVVTAIFARQCVGIWSTPTLSRKLLLESIQIIRNHKE